MLSCPSRKSAAERQRAEALKKMAKLAGPVYPRLNKTKAKSQTATTTTAKLPSKCPKDLLTEYLAAWPQFTAVMNQTFPGSMSIGQFLADLTANLNSLGFQQGEAIAMCSVCRDELTRPFVDAVELLWGNSFSLGSIAAMMFAGTTGLTAGMHHSPVENGVDRFIFIVAPHIAISDQGVIGKVWRPGVPTISSACGSLAAFQTELSSGTVNFQISFTDTEQTWMKEQMSTHFPYGAVPALADLTKDAQVLIQSQLEAVMATFDLVGDAEYAVVSGIQIHGPAAANFFYPTTFYFVGIDGSKTDIGFQSFGQNQNKKYLEVLAPISF